jgi:hypothetical protein
VAITSKKPALVAQGQEAEESKQRGQQDVGVAVLQIGAGQKVSTDHPQKSIIASTIGALRR